MDSNPGTEPQAAEHDYLVKLWSEQLNRPHIDLDVDFFEAGGSSMQVIEMLMTVTNKFGKDIDFAEFFTQPNILRLSQLLAN